MAGLQLTANSSVAALVTADNKIPLSSVVSLHSLKIKRQTSACSSESDSRWTGCTSAPFNQERDCKYGLLNGMDVEVSAVCDILCGSSP